MKTCLICKVISNELAKTPTCAAAHHLTAVLAHESQLHQFSPRGSGRRGGVGWEDLSGCAELGQCETVKGRGRRHWEGDLCNGGAARVALTGHACPGRWAAWVAVGACEGCRQVSEGAGRAAVQGCGAHEEAGCGRSRRCVGTGVRGSTPGPHPRIQDVVLVAAKFTRYSGVQLAVRGLDGL